jgi:ADP-heptose:LPS heptosyltransferase
MILAHAPKGASVVVSRTYAWGDVILATAVIYAILQERSDLKIFFHTHSEIQPLLKHYPDIELIKDAEALRQATMQSYGVIILDNVPELYEEGCLPDVQLNRIEIMCRHLGVQPVKLCPSYYITENEDKFGRAAIEKLQRPFLGIAPVSRRIEKMWLPERWVDLVKQWRAETGGTVFVFHSDDLPELREAGAVPLYWHNIRLMVAVGVYMNCFVCLDSLWSHLAAALTVPQVLLTSCTDGELLAKGYPRVKTIHGELSCHPCWYLWTHMQCSVDNPPACLKGVSAGMVLEAIRSLLQEAWNGFR